MTRRLRKYIIAPGALYHIVCRGVNQQRIFRAARDYKKFLKILIQAKEKFDFYLYSFNLLPNHIHMEIEANQVSISKIMHYINTYYAIYFNRRYKRKGHLFQDRFYSSLINDEPYFWTVSAYVDLNAVRAKLCNKPEDYRWSSYSIYTQKHYSGSLIDRDRFLRFDGDGPIEKLRRNYLDFVDEQAKHPENPEFIEDENSV